eukprot:757944-Hanusia_phi.AAC.4
MATRRRDEERERRDEERGQSEMKQRQKEGRKLDERGRERRKIRIAAKFKSTSAVQRLQRS